MLPPEPMLLAAHRDADATAALACADWLDEHDAADAAGLVRATVAAHEADPLASDAAALRDRADRLGDRDPFGRAGLSYRHAEMVHELRAQSRGFPGWVRCDPGAADATLAALFDAWPARKLALGQAGPRQLGRALGQPWADRLCGLAGALTPGRERGTRVLATRGANLRLASLWLGQVSAPEDYRDLAAAPLLAHVRELELYNAVPPPGAVAALGRSPHAAAVARLGLNGYLGGGVAAGNPTLPEADARALTAGDGWPGLRELALSHLVLPESALADARGLARLRHLLLRDVSVPPAAWDRLGGALAGGSLRAFDLSYSGHLGYDHFDRLLNAWADAGNLRCVDLSACNLPPAALLRLAAWPGLGRVCELDLSGNTLDAPAARALAQSPYAANLRRLELRNTRLEPPALSALSALPPGRLRELSVGPPRPGDPAGALAALRTLLRSPAARGLRRLHLRGFVGGRELSNAVADADLPDLGELAILGAALSAADAARLLGPDAPPSLWRLRTDVPADSSAAGPPGWERRRDGFARE